MEGFALLRFVSFSKKGHANFFHIVWFSTKLIYLYTAAACKQRNIARLVYTSTVNVVFGGLPIEDGDEETVPYFPTEKVFWMYYIFKFPLHLLSCFWRSLEFSWPCFAWCQNPGTRKKKENSWHCLWIDTPQPWHISFMYIASIYLFVSHQGLDFGK